MKIIPHPLFFQQQLLITDEAPGTVFSIIGSVLSTSERTSVTKVTEHEV